VLIIADEAPGIESGVRDAIAGAMAGGRVRIVMAGNPTLPAGAFFDAFSRLRGIWNCIIIDAFDSPNMKGLGLQQLLEMDPTDGGPLDQNPVPHLVTRRWVYEQCKVWWHRDEASSPNWMARVRGQFPDQAQNALIKLLWLERARLRTVPHTGNQSGASLVAGVDVGGGQSETVVYICESKPHHHRVINFGARLGSDTRGEVIRFLEPYREQLSSVRVEGIGIGHGFGHHLRDQGFPVELVNVALACASQPELGESDPAKRFVNEKARVYQVLADALEHDQLDGLADETTSGQLAGILYEIDSRGRLRIEPKEGASPRGRVTRPR
jgi:hypothetical protein